MARAYSLDLRERVVAAVLRGLSCRAVRFDVSVASVVKWAQRARATGSPAARPMGGTPTWKNVVAACSNCNLRKGDLLPTEARMWPARMPYQPSVNDLHQNGRQFPPNYLHESWMDYLYWDSVLEP